MYDVIKNVLMSGSFELSNILAKIDTLWLQGRVTDTERDELIAMARTKADPVQSFAPWQAQIDALAKRVAALESKEKETDTETPKDEYTDYVQPTGAHDAYYNGAKVKFNAKRYDCIAPEGVAVVWSPEVYPPYWQEVTE